MSGIDFVLSGFASDLQTTVDATLPGTDIPALTGGGFTAVYEMDVQVFRDVFQIHVDSQDLDNGTLTTSSNLGDIKYYVDNTNNLNVADSTTANWPATQILNPCHAMCNFTDNIDTTYTTDSAGTNHLATRMMVKHDYVRWMAYNLFGTAHGVDLFNNEAEVVEDIAEQGANMWTQFIKYKLDYVNTKGTTGGQVAATVSDTTNSNNDDGSGVAANYLTNGSNENYTGTTGYNPGVVAVTNVCKVLFDQMIKTQPVRFSNVVSGGLSPYAPNTNNVSGDARVRTENSIGGTYDRIPLPFIEGDSITFQQTLKCVADQGTLTGGTIADSVFDRIFNIKIILKDTTASGAATTNTTPDDSGSSYTANYIVN